MTKDELTPIDISKYRITETGQVTRMTEEDLRKQATSTVERENTPVLDRPLFVHAYITGAKPRENRIEELEKENGQLEEELSKRILEQQKTIGSLTDTIDELKAHCTAVDEVNEKMKCCGNCGFAIHNRLDGTFCGREAEYRQANEKCNKWRYEL